MGGRKPAVSHADLKDSIIKEDVVNAKGEVHGPTHEVWEKLANFHDNKITANYVYVYTKCNRHNVLNEVWQAKGIKVVDSKEEKEDDTTQEEDDTDDEDCGEKTAKLQKPTAIFSVLIPAEKWIQMKPVKSVVKRSDRPSDRSKLVLPRFGWEPIIIECLWDQHRIPCPYSFSGAYVSSSALRECYIKINATCHECGAVATGTILSEPADNEKVPLQWHATDTRGIPHRRKRHLSHDLRQEMGKVLQGRSVAAFRKDDASRKMIHGDVEPPHLFSEEVMRKTQQQTLDADYNILDSKDPVKNLQDMKKTPPFAGSIHQIASDPFFVHYHSPTQLHVFKKFASLTYLVLAIDATGSLVRRLVSSNGEKSPHIFLYEGVIKAGTKQVPVFQMLSARQDANCIEFWITEYLRQGCPTPNEVVVDHSKALINAVVRTFCGCSTLQDYFGRCFYILRNPELSEEDLSIFLPRSYLRLDVAHIIGGASKWKEWQVVALKRFKLFYLMCLGLLILETSLEGFRETLIMIGVVAQSPFRDTEVAASLQSLSERIKGAPAEVTDLISEDSEAEEDADDISDDEEPCEEIQDYFSDINQQIKTRCGKVSSKEPNAYFSSEIYRRFRILLPDFLLWTAVMVETFRSPTATGSSARVESYFNTLKNGILGGKKRLYRLDKFVAIHLKHSDGDCHVANAKQVLTNFEETEKDPDDDKSDKEENEKRAENAKTTENEKPAEKETTADNKKKVPNEKNSTKSKRRHSVESATSDIDSETEEQKNRSESENWRGKAPTPKKSKTAKYLNPLPELSLVMECNSLTPPKERLLLNGLMKGFSKTTNSTHAQVKNTCAFDVLAQVVTCGYIQYGVYRTGLEAHLDCDFLQTCKSLAEKGAVQETYMLRLDTLSKITDPTAVVAPQKSTLRRRKTSLSITYDCYNDLVDLSRILLKNVTSATVTFSCSLRRFRPCMPEEEHCVINADMEVLLYEGMRKLDKAVLVALKMMDSSSEDCPVENNHSTSCSKPCTGLSSVRCEFGPHLLINVDVFGSSGQHEAMRSTVAIQDFPTKLNLLGEKSFVLCGIGARQSAHYVAYGRRATGQWEMFNDTSKKVRVVKDSKEVQPVILLYAAL